MHTHPAPPRSDCPPDAFHPTSRASTPAALRRLQELFPNHGNLDHPDHAWLREVRAAGTAERAAFDVLFEGSDHHLHYRQGDPASLATAAQTALGFYERSIRDGVQGKTPFRDGVLASLLGALSPHLKVLGHPYDDLMKALKAAFGKGPREPSWASTQTDAAQAHQMEAQTGLHIHQGKPLPEIGTVLALTLATSFLVDGPGKKLPWVVQTALKAAGAYPFYQHLVRGEVTHALAHLGEGKHLQDTVKQLLVCALLLSGVLMRGGSHALAAGSTMSAILSAVGKVQTDAASRTFGAQQRILDSLPAQAMEVHQDHTHERPVAKLVPGKSIIQLVPGTPLPVDVTLTALPPGLTSVRVDSHRSRGQMAQRCTVGDRLDQGSVLLDALDTPAQARVEASADDSLLSRQVRDQRTYQASDRQSTATRVGEGWIWGTVGGTLLVTLSSLLQPLLRKEKVELPEVLRRATSFATLSSPCAVLVSTLIEGSTGRRLVPEGLVPLQGNALTLAEGVTHHCFDFTGTCSLGAEFAGATFFDEAGRPVQPEESARLLAQVTAAGMAAQSQHLKQKALRRALLASRSPEAAQAQAAGMQDAHEDVGQGVRARWPGTPEGAAAGGTPGDGPSGDSGVIRTGKREYALAGSSLAPAQLAALTGISHHEESLTYARVGNRVGVLRFTDRIRDGARKTFEALGPTRSFILSGDQNRDFVLSHTRKLGIPDENVFTDLSPDDKAARIRTLKEQGKVAMVGDGMNDAAALRAADVRYALADTVHDGILNEVHFLTPNLASIPPMQALSRRVNRTSLVTLGFSVLYTGLTSILEAAGVTKLPVVGAALAHEGVSGAIAMLHDHLSRSYVQDFARDRDLLFGG